MGRRPSPKGKNLKKTQENSSLLSMIVNAGAKLHQWAAVKMHHGPALAHRS
jgi:hypothetical protein